MGAMEIENYEGTADTFTWPNNPQSFDDTLTSNHQMTPIGFLKHHIAVSGGGISPTTIVLSGHFYGSDKWTYYRNMSKHFGDTTSFKKIVF
jgi:hypothetical protein